MPYVLRDEQGVLVSVSVEKNEREAEWIEPDAAELQAFLARIRGGDLPDALNHLINTDWGLIRVLEDLVDALIAKDVILFTDIPEAAQKKLLERRSLRDSMNSLNLLKDDDQGLI